MRLPLAALALPAVLVPLSWGQSPFSRGSDWRTAAPEAIVGDRQAWGADLNFGGSFNRGNTDVNYAAAGGALFARRGPHTAYLSGAMMYNSFGGVRVLNAGSLTSRYDRVVSGRWKAFAYNTQAYNEFIRLNHRTTTGGGPWYDAELGPLRSGLSAALTHEYERFKGGVIERAGRLSLRALNRLPISPVAELGADFFYVPKLDEFSDNRIYAELSLKTLFWRDNLGLKLSWIDEYDSRPKPGVRRNDTLWLTSLTLHFGR